MPRVGASVRIRHFGGSRESGVITAVLDDGRRLQVRGEAGAMHEFVLNPATARFTSAEGAQGARLDLLSR